MYLEKAVDLADRLSAVFDDSPSGLPYPYVNLLERKGVHSKDYTGLVSVAEVGTLQLEFKYLSHITDDPTYWRYVEKVWPCSSALRFVWGC
jgi:mannosyl-oligosaccharide alpha-1,2-mannosidase